MIPVTDEAYKLMHRGSIALSQVEATGMRIDTDYLQKAIETTKNKITKRNNKLKTHKIYRRWKKIYGSKTNLGSRQQLGKILFEVMKYDCPSLTKTGRPQVTEAVLEGLDIPFVQAYIKTEKLKKALATYLKGIMRETANGFLHPFFPLNLVQTYRGSSEQPNFHNIPQKNPIIRKLIRRAFIARRNHQIVEVDYSGAEICGATCYHKDPRMIQYIKTSPGKLHTDMASKCYMIPISQVSWNARDTSKNMFVFPEFYGDFYIHCAKNMWEALHRRKIKTTDGISILKHLKEKGIYELGACDYEQKAEDGTFEKHIQEVEHNFWNKRFKVYSQWKKDWYEEYLKKGWFETLTGFIIEGYYKRNEVINYPIQGTAFHWLLWSLIRIQKLLTKYNMRSLIIGQIHDSINGDVYKKELRNYLEICNQVMTIDVRKHWPWIIVPLTIEAKVAPVGGSWYDIEDYKI